MPVIARCPNVSCGHVSQLVDDPLGRIFRCPRCLTKLPTAPAAAADSGWTAIVRPTLRAGSRAAGAEARSGDGSGGSRRGRAAAWPTPMPMPGAGWGSPWRTGTRGIRGHRGLDSGGVRSAGSASRAGVGSWAGSDPGFGLGRERRDVRRADVAGREPGLGVERASGRGSASARLAGRGRRPRSRPRASRGRRGLGRGRAVGAVPGPGRAGPGGARHGLSRL